MVYFAASQIFRIGQQALILGIDDRKKTGEASNGKTRPEETKPSKKSDPKPVTPTKRPAAQRRPQGSKKKRGKKRRRR